RVEPSTPVHRNTDRANARTTHLPFRPRILRLQSQNAAFTSKMKRSLPARVEQFDTLCRTVGQCRTCPRMNDSARVLNRGAGPLDAGLMFIGEAPGRLGADASELPFHGDKAGHNFEELLSVAGLTRASVFVTNAVLCNPRDDHGNNAMPTRAEVEACSAFMRAQIELLQPKIVVTLGATALNAGALIERHGLTLRDSVRTAHRWYGRLLVPLYHP